MSVLHGVESGVLHGCARCGRPADALAFDVSGITGWRPETREVVLARFDLPVQYCGVLESMWQFTDLNAADPADISTPTLEWRVLIDRNPVAPYLNLRWLINPFGSFAPPVTVRLSPGARVELVVRRVPPAPAQPARHVPPVEPAIIGGRITGCYWYDPSFGAPRGGHV